MKLYLLSQDKNEGYDTYDSAVVAAGSEKEARLIHPAGSEHPWSGVESGYQAWCNAVDVKVHYLGEADDSVYSGVVCASFNAG